MSPSSRLYRRRKWQAMLADTPARPTVGVSAANHGPLPKMCSATLTEPPPLITAGASVFRLRHEVDPYPGTSATNSLRSSGSQGRALHLHGDQRNPSCTLKPSLKNRNSSFPTLNSNVAVAPFFKTDLFKT